MKRRTFLLGALAALLVPAAVHAAAPTFDAASSVNTNTLGVMTWAHVVGATADGLLIGVAVRGDQAVTGVTWNGSSTGVTVVTVRHDGAGNSGCELWKVIAPTTGTHNIVVTTNGSGSPMAAGAISLIGTHQTTPVTASATAGDTSGGSASLTVNVTSSTAELVVGVGCATIDNTFVSTGTAQTERVDTGDTNGMGVTMATQTGAATTTHSYTESSNKEWTTIAASVQAPAAAGNKAGPLVGDIPMKSLVGGGLAR